MQTVAVKLDASGNGTVPGAGCGFRIARARAPGAAMTDRPGAFPVRVTPEGAGAVDEPTLEVGSSSPMYLDRPFRALRLAGVAGDCYRVTVLASHREAVVPSSRLESAAVSLGSSVVPTSAPSTASDGWQVRPGQRAWTFYAVSGPQDCTLWVRTAAGNWRNTGYVLPFLSDTTRQVETLSVIATADRVALVAAAGGCTVEVDAECEVE